VNLRHLLLTIGIVCGLTSGVPAHAAPPLRMLFTAAGCPPLYLTDPNQPGKLNGGFIKDFGELLASALGTTVSFVETTRNRVEWRLSEGHADMVCNANPAWYGTAQLLKWTPAIFSRVEVIVTRTEDWKPRSIDELANHTLGTLLGYRYPQLDPLFSSGSLQRHDEMRLSENFAQLDLKLIDGLVTTRDEALAYLSHQVNAAHYRISDFTISRQLSYCAVSPQSKWAIQDINQALAKLQSSGQLTELRKRYNLDSP